MNLNFLDILREDYKKWKDKPFIYEKDKGIYKSVTFGDFIESAVYLAESLLDMNLEGNNILIYGPNSTQWMIADIAVMSFVGSSTGIGNANYNELNALVKKLEPKAIIYDESHNISIKELKTEHKEIKYISMDDFEMLIKKGKVLNSKRENLLDFSYIEKDSFIKGVLTSGTTASPKIVMLSETNIFYGWKYLNMRAPMNDSDSCYLFLPLYHTYGSIFNFIYSLISGMSIYLSSSVPSLADELDEIRPTVFSAVPYIYERIYEEKGEGIKDIFKNARYLFSGGAKLNNITINNYNKNGLSIIPAYALSETASSFSIGYPGDNDKQSQGTLFEDLDIKISEADEHGYGELLVRGDNIFLGYFGDEKATSNSFDSDGYFMTGDIGKIDSDNRVFINGRKDSVTILPNGKKYTQVSWKEKNL